MLYKTSTLFSLFIIICLSSCNMLEVSSLAKEKTQEMVEAIIDKDYDKCFSLLSKEQHDINNLVIRDSLIHKLDYLSDVITSKFGKEFKFRFIESRKDFSNQTQNNLPNTTKALIEFENKKEFGVFEVLFDDKTKTILRITILDIRRPIPNTSIFWSLIIIPIGVICFNIYMIVQVRKSSLNKKWVKYLAILLLNVPTITYSLIHGFNFKLFEFQFLLGGGFSYGGYINTILKFGIPIGALYWFF